MIQTSFVLARSISIVGTLVTVEAIAVAAVVAVVVATAFRVGVKVGVATTVPFDCIVFLVDLSDVVVKI